VIIILAAVCAISTCVYVFHSSQAYVCEKQEHNLYTFIGCLVTKSRVNKSCIVSTSVGIVGTE
jgi:hypothetical protein